MRGPGKLALLAGLAVASIAGGDEPDDGGLWADIARPDRGRAAQLVIRAEGLIPRAPDRAALLLEEAIALDPARPLAFYLLGQARYHERAWARCADALETVQRLDPAFMPAPRTDGAPASRAVDDMLGLCLALAGRHDAAVAHYRRMLLAPPAGAGLDILHGNLGDCYLALGRLDEAVAEFLAGIALAPRRSGLWFGLAVAYDRDERVARARDAMLSALELNPQLGELGSPNNFFVPAEDGFYYYGLAHQVAAEADPPRRAAAIAHFRKYLDIAPPGPSIPRARRHLAELGSSALGARDIAVHPHDADAAAAAARLAAALPDLQRCFEGQPHLATRVTLTFAAPAPGDKRRPPEAGALTLGSLGAGVAPLEVNGCIEKRLQSVRHAPRHLTRLSVVLISR